MKLAVMQPYLFPYIGYFQLLNAADKFIVYDDVSFINRGWINRNHILIDGRAGMFSVPLSKASQNGLIKDTAIDRASFPRWEGKFLRTLEQNYRQAPYFEPVMEVISRSLRDHDGFISRMAVKGIQSVLDYLNIERNLALSSATYANQHLRGAERIIDICRIELADTYINPIGGLKIYERDHFAGHSISLYFLKPGRITYRQHRDPFVPDLSIIDVLMFNGIGDVHRLLDQYELI